MHSERAEITDAVAKRLVNCRRRWWPHCRRRHDFGTRLGIGLPASWWSAGRLARRYGHIYQATLQVPSRRCPAHQFPLAQEHTTDAGQCTGWAQLDHESLCRGHRAAIPVFSWRCYADIVGVRVEKAGLSKGPFWRLGLTRSREVKCWAAHGVNAAFALDISFARLLNPSRSAAEHTALRSPSLRPRVKQNSPTSCRCSSTLNPQHSTPYSQKRTLQNVIASATGHPSTPIRSRQSLSGGGVSPSGAHNWPTAVAIASKAIAASRRICLHKKLMD